MENRRTTIVDVARAARVSVSTASRALNDRDRVDERTRLLVRGVAAELDYRPNVRAQRLRTGRSQSIALVTALPEQVVNEVSELGFMLELSMPIAKECLNRGYTLTIVPPVSDVAQLDALDVDGAVVMDASGEDPITSRLRSRGVKVVTLGRAAHADGYLDRGSAGADVMLAHLAAQGARHVGVMLSVEDYSVTSTVLEFIESGAAPVRCTVLRAHASEGESAGHRAALDTLRADPTLDAIYAPLDAFAAGAIRAADELGIAVPDRVMVATNYDGRRATASEPPITALDLDFPALGREIAGLVFAALDTDGVHTAPSPSPRVIPRASTARLSAPRSDEPDGR
ncbi:substrate-binding domain-containing protein [Microbacterium esteraromaticum]|uniref:substrate-binding domain-containing protein n=1 Tax=Microbacterium esteraromaticum TaxID=57043 RepID=UPI0015F72CF2|nr:substrate-binding domain-containing protein [Microbacterium esteraromaticum]